MASEAQVEVGLETRARTLGVFLAVFVPLLVIYLLVPNPGLHPKGNHGDPLTNAVTAWHLGMKGTVVLDDFAEATGPDYYGSIGWFVDSPRGPTSQYPPGAAIFAAPFYRLANQPHTEVLMRGSNKPDAPPISLPMPSMRPGSVAASVAVAGAMGFMALATVSAAGSWTLGVGAGLVGGIATPLWPVAASALWLHGPAAFWICLGVFLASRNLHFWAGLAIGGAVLARPHAAAIALGIGCMIAWKERSWRPALLVGVGSSLGLLALLGYNWWLWGVLTITGGYSSDFREGLVSADPAGFLENIIGALADPRVGIFVVTPFLVLLLLRVRPALLDGPAWARGAALGRTLYLLIQLKANLHRRCWLRRVQVPPRGSRGCGTGTRPRLSALGSRIAHSPLRLLAVGRRIGRRLCHLVGFAMEMIRQSPVPTLRPVR